MQRSRFRERCVLSTSGVWFWRNKNHPMSVWGSLKRRSLEIYPRGVVRNCLRIDLSDKNCRGVMCGKLKTLPAALKCQTSWRTIPSEILPVRCAVLAPLCWLICQYAGLRIQCFHAELECQLLLCFFSPRFPSTENLTFSCARYHQRFLHYYAWAQSKAPVSYLVTVNEMISTGRFSIESVLHPFKTVIVSVGGDVTLGLGLVVIVVRFYGS